MVGSASPFLSAVSVCWTMAGKVDASGPTTMPRHCMVLGWIPVHQVSFDLFFKCKARSPYQLLFNIMTFSSALSHCQYYQVFVLCNITICFVVLVTYNVPSISYLNLNNLKIQMAHVCVCVCLRHLYNPNSNGQYRLTLYFALSRHIRNIEDYWGVFLGYRIV